MSKVVFIFVLVFILSEARDPKDILQDINIEIEKLLNVKNESNELYINVQEIHKLKNKTIYDETVCQACCNVINHLIVYRRGGASKESMRKYMKKLCLHFSSWGNVACNGYVDIEIETILFIIDNKRNLTPERVCALHFQENKCQDPNAEKWEIIIPPKSGLNKKKKLYNDSNDLKILHITDIHYDPLYQPGSNAVCDEPLCCQSGTPTNSSNAAGYWGDYHVCDTPWHSVQNLMNQVKNEENLDYVYFTGDITSHKSWTTSKDLNTDSIKTIYKLFDSTFHSKKVYPILGNHEPHPTDFYSPDNLSNTKVSTKWVLDLVAEEWSRWLPEDTKATIRKGGYYTVLVRPGFRIIGINSNVCYTANLWLIYEDVDPNNQLQWLVDVLLEAEKNNERVHLLSHIPPGEVSCHKQWSHEFRRVINRFSETISAQFNGHTHKDELRLFYDMNNENEAINVAYNGGSFTPFVGFNPNYRTYTIDSSNFTVLDFNQYIYSLSDANENKNVPPNWYKLYSFKEAYGLPNTNLDSLSDLVIRMQKDINLVKLYHRYLVRDSVVNEECDQKCLKSLLCSITAVETNDSVNCL